MEYGYNHLEGIRIENEAHLDFEVRQANSAVKDNQQQKIMAELDRKILRENNQYVREILRMEELVRTRAYSMKGKKILTDAEVLEILEKDSSYHFWKKFIEPEKKIYSKKSVCQIANKISRSISRKDAFLTAWKIIKNGGYEIKVAGVSFENRQEALKRLTTYRPEEIHTILVPEFDNPYDSNAISVQVLVNGSKNVYRIGYVPKEETAIVKAFIGKVPALKVLDGDIRGARLRLAA